MIGDARDAFTLTPAEQLGSVWLVRKGSEVRALSATCPHLGCAIDLAGDKKASLPLPHLELRARRRAAERARRRAAMDALATRVKDGWVEVDFRKYRQGTAEKKEVGA
jgi:menaquinol-cytochrome c reductase iron-sulfur subunit